MPTEKQHHHRPTGLKQTNKAFKSKHATKGLLKEKSKGTGKNRLQLLHSMSDSKFNTSRLVVLWPLPHSGKVNRVPIKNQGLKGRSTKADRRNAAKLFQQKKREELVRSNRLFEGRHGAPKIVAVVPLCPDVDAEATVARLYTSLGQEAPANPGLKILKCVVADRFKQKHQFIPLRRNFVDIIDAFKVADFAILLMSADIEVDKFGLLCLSAVQSQGLVSVVPVVQHLENVIPKLRNSVKKSLISFTKQFFPEEDKLLAIDSDTVRPVIISLSFSSSSALSDPVAPTLQDAVSILRYISEQRPKPLTWRDQHPYLIAEHVSFAPGFDGDHGTLAVTGYARGVPFNANRLVHLQNFGDFQVEKIVSSPPSNTNVSEMEEDVRVLDSPSVGEQDDLLAENEPDLMANEQTWPTEEELAEADGGYERIHNLRRGSDSSLADTAVPTATIKPGVKVTKRVPKGTSSYQAAWIVDDEDEDEYTDEDEDENMGSGEDGQDTKDHEDGNRIEGDEDEEFEEVEEESKASGTVEQLDPDEEERQLQDYLGRQKEHRDDVEFPDEVDTPLNIPARTRFARSCLSCLYPLAHIRYRGLQSFRTSPWDPFENLPIDYARIFQFENYKRTKSRVVGQAMVGVVKPGSHITIHITNVPKELLAKYDSTRPFIVFGLLQYEHKISVLNFTVARNSEYTSPIKSKVRIGTPFFPATRFSYIKDPLVLHVGFRRFVVHPLYSQNTQGGKGTNNVHKFERFLQLGRTSIATVFGPIQFGNLPCLLFKETEDVNAPVLVATGAFHDADPKRIVAKRIVLTGHPFKINKRSAVIRYMFFNPEDVMWFKPVQLSTKFGRTGHIRESLGTHGYMKCIFDGPVTQQDTVMMNLYKRVFPKWNTELWRSGVDGRAVTGGEEGERKGIVIVEEAEMEL
ncbi:hypothetical protein BC937DRAFT_93407 [Endogone sp. FLAS-F59071]|nr:hypothetical protein BC937DRAFT_93407 [Endogone sp. FLAS-F59071]|eukprot:RUS21181.1 hypothetical protein BC937DRAFT_93407 [Endogone sp. FLAS-F59071]